MSTLSNKDKNEQEKISRLIKQGGGNEHPGEKSDYDIKSDPLFQDINADKKAEIDKAVEKKIKSLTIDENVDTDSTTVPGQNYALISIVAPSGNQKHDSVCLKIKGVYEKLEDAKQQAEILQKFDDTFDIFVVELYKWLLVPPDPELLEQVHVDKKLNEILGGHREDQLKSKMYFEERKRELMENIKVENEENIEKNKLELEELKDSITEETETEPESKDTGIKIETLNIGEEQCEEQCEELNAFSSESVQNEILGNCPNSAETSTPSEIMEDMVHTKVVESPSHEYSN